MKVKINEKYAKVIEALSSEEYKLLEESIIAEGCRDAICVLADGTIIDGHNRFEICTKHNIEYKTTIIDIVEEDVEEWMYKNQLGKRNLTDEQRRYYNGKYYEANKQKHGTNRHNSREPKSGSLEKPLSDIAKELDLPKSTIKENGIYSKGIDAIAEVAPEVKTNILSGNSDFTKQNVIDIAKAKKESEEAERNKIKEEEYKQQEKIKEEEIQRRIAEANRKAVEEALAKQKEESRLKEVEKKNRYAKAALKAQEAKTQAQQNIIVAEEIDVKFGEVYVINGKHKLIVGDSFDVDSIKKHLPKIDCVITDPPYGIGYKSPSGSGLTARGDYKVINGDKTAFNPDVLFEYCDKVVTWGANHYANNLPNSAGWLVWDKRDGDAINLNSDVELAWSNCIGSARMFHHKWNGMIKESEKNSKRVHPTQKPIELMAWCIDIVNAGDNILDLFGGSGTTLIACENRAKTCYIVENDTDYASVMIKRFKELGYTVEKEV